jgi:hypothetical protein
MGSNPTLSCSLGACGSCEYILGEEIFSPKNFAKKLACLTQNKAKLCKKLIIASLFEKNANFFAEN